jgi:hypothetical protein
MTLEKQTDFANSAYELKDYLNLIRQVGPHLRLYVPRLILGTILSSIVGDDGNVFGIFFHQDWATLVKAPLLERMEYEVSLPETPDSIKTRLQSVIKLVKPLDLTVGINYYLAKARWTEVRDWVSQQAEEKPDWSRAMKYELSFGRNSEYWTNYLRYRLK